MTDHAEATSSVSSHSCASPDAAEGIRCASPPLHRSYDIGSATQTSSRIEDVIEPTTNDHFAPVVNENVVSNAEPPTVPAKCAVYVVDLASGFDAIKYT
jgi:hypothetical protein